MSRVAGAMLKEALDYAGVPVKAIAQDTHYSDDAYYAAMAGKKPFPKGAKKKISEVHVLGGLAVCYENTGYRIFKRVDGDRHIQSMLTRSLKEDRERDAALKDMNIVLLDKYSRDDLSLDEASHLKQALIEVLQSIQVDFGLVVEMDTKFSLGVMDWLKENNDTRRQAECR